MNDYEVGELLAEGGFGMVYLARKKGEKEFVALKSIDIQKSYGIPIDTEINILSLLNHNHIIKFIESRKTETSHYLIMEYAENDLFDFLIEYGRFDEKTTYKYMLQLSDAVSYIHNLNIMHRDIKLENILIIDNNIKLCDFGWATYDTENFTEKCGTLDYTSPEMVNGMKYNKSVDIWSIGIVTFEMLTAKTPFYDPNIYKTMKNISNASLSFPSYISDAARIFISLLLVKEPKMRMKANDIKIYLENLLLINKIDK